MMYVLPPLQAPCRSGGYLMYRKFLRFRKNAKRSSKDRSAVFFIPTDCTSRPAARQTAAGDFHGGLIIRNH